MTHGHTNKGVASPTLNAYRNMINRCYTPCTDRYENYGGRGITVCDQWRKGFEFFLRDMGVKPDGLTLERIDVNGNYDKMNCCWVGAFLQCRNKTSTIRVKCGGEDMCLADAAKSAGMNYHTLYMRYQRGARGEELYRPLERGPTAVKRKRAHSSSTIQVNDIPALELPKLQSMLPVVSLPETSLNPG